VIQERAFQAEFEVIDMLLAHRRQGAVEVNSAAVLYTFGE
jgi:hypothetical protein